MVLGPNSLLVAARVDFADGLVLVGNDRAGAQALHGSRFAWTRAPAAWQTSFRELAALLAAGWTRLGIADQGGLVTEASAFVTEACQLSDKFVPEQASGELSASGGSTVGP